MNIPSRRAEVCPLGKVAFIHYCPEPHLNTSIASLNSNGGSAAYQCDFAAKVKALR